MTITVPVSQIPISWRKELPQVSDDTLVFVSLKVCVPDPEVEQQKKEGKIESFEIHSKKDFEKMFEALDKDES